jgi:Family of unknown function (DUF5989)
MSHDSNEFERSALNTGRTGLLGELWGFMKENKRWWLLPILVFLLIFGLLLVLGGTGAAPFIYTLF